MDIGKRKFGESLNSANELARNGDMGTVISISASGGNGIIPHLAAHVAALTAITECHTDYLPECAHLFNVTKWKLCHQIVKPIERLQQLEYTYAPVRVIIAALHHAWTTNSIPNDELQGLKHTKNLAKDLFLLSERKESNEMISKYKLERSQSTVAKLHSGARENVPLPSGNNQSIVEGKKKYQRSNAYDRIRSSSVSRNSSNRSSELSVDQNNNDSNNIESDEDDASDESSKKDKRTFMKKLLKFGGSLMGKRKSNDNSTNDSDEEGSSDVSDEESEETSDEEDSISEGSKKTKPKLLKSIIGAFSFR